MTNLSHWQDNIDDALGGEFDGSLSGLCIMSLSFDFTRTNGPGTHLGSSRDTNAVSTANINQQAPSGPLGVNSFSGGKVNNYGANIGHESLNDNSNNCFKRFKSAAVTNDTNQDDENRSNNQSKIVRQQLQHLKNCLNSTPVNSNAALTHHTSVTTTAPQSQAINNGDSDDNRTSPGLSESSCNRASALSTTSDSSRSSSPTPSCTSSISSHSRASSRSHSPTDMAAQNTNNNQNNNNISISERNFNATNTNFTANRYSLNQNEHRAHSAHDNQQVSVYSVKDSLLNGSTLKESSYTTSVITTTAPMHFKSLHHPFSIKQFPLSPYHQFSNSSLNHDFYDRYLSHDSHQPLQTPLIGIERTQDFLSLKLPPHGPEEIDSQKFNKDWPFEENKQDTNDQVRSKSSESSDKQDKADNVANHLTANSNPDGVARKETETEAESQKGFPFNYKSISGVTNGDKVDQREPIDLNVSYTQTGCCNDGNKNNIFDESMKHFNPDRIQQDSCYDHRSKNASSNQSNEQPSDEENVANLVQQYHGQESMFGMDPSKQKFQYILAAPISVATKLNEDTMTYLNQGQAYEIKLENMTDVAEAKKGFMCSIINIGFHERHMQQAEYELWQQWSHQHPNEKIFSVDMKLSYNVFGVESDGLNKYEFLWDSSKAAGVFIRINSISTEFTQKKHGGEKGVPFKLSIETFSYNSKTHDSYFISAACCQMKVFKPKGAERKIRSDRDKISKRPIGEQEKYNRSCDHTVFRECSLTSLHPMAEGSLCYYRHSHGHFASKQVVTATSVGGTPSAVQAQQASTHHQEEEGMDHNNSVASQQNQSPDNHQSPELSRQSSQTSNDNETTVNDQSCSNQARDYQNSASRNAPLANKTNSDYSANRLMQHNHFGRNSLDSSDQTDNDYVPQNSHHTHTGSESSFNHSGEQPQLPQPSTFNHQMYHGNPVRGVASLTSINNSQHFGMAYYSHSLPTSMPPHIPPPQNYGASAGSGSNSMSNTSHGNHNVPMIQQQHMGARGGPSLYTRPSNHEKHNLSVPTTNGTSFKACNLALTGPSNFQTYLNNHTDSCADNPSQEPKDGTLSTGSYQHEAYDSHLQHSSHTASQQQQPQFRQRSASTSFAQHNGGLSYMGHTNNQSRHSDSYAGGNSGVLHDSSNPISANSNWMHNSQPNHSQLTSVNSSCAQRGISNFVGHHNDAQSYNGGHSSYGIYNHLYDSGQSSPYKNHQHASESSSTSCESRFKNNPSTMTCNSYLGPYENTKTFNSRITTNSNCGEVVSWFTSNRFGLFAKTFNNYCGSDLLRLSKTELIEICGLIDGIRLYNSLHNQPIKPRRVLYVCYKNSEVFHPIYLYDVTLRELIKELSSVFQSNMPSNNNRMTMEDKQKLEKPVLNSNSSNDSRSSMGASSNETGADDGYARNELCFREVEDQSHGKCFKSNVPGFQIDYIDRIVIDGITSVKIVATEQVVQMLEDESVWTLSFNSGNAGLVEACISACRTKRPSK